MNLFNIIDIKLVDRLIGGQTDRLTKNTEVKIDIQKGGQIKMQMDRQTGNKTDERQSIKLCTGNNDGIKKKKQCFQKFNG